MEPGDDDKRPSLPDELSAPVAGKPTPSVIRVQLKCATEAEFQQRYAAQFAAPFFIAQEMRVKDGDRVRVHIALAGDVASLRGVAEVSPATRAGKPGVMVRLVEVEPDGLQLRARGKSKSGARRGPAVVRRTPSSSPPSPLPDLSAREPNNEFEEPTRKSTLSERVAATLRHPADEDPGDADELPELPLEDIGAEAKAGRAASEPILLTRRRTPVPGIPTAASAPVPGIPTAASAPAASAPVPPVEAAPATRRAPTPAPSPSASGSRSRRPIVVGLAAVAVIAVVAIALTRGGDDSPSRPEPSTADRDRLAAEISAADTRIRSGDLVGDDGALGHLVTARAIAPEDPSVRTRLTALADKFEQLADAAVAAGNHAEAAVHLRAARDAEPDRAGIAARLADVERQLARAADAGAGDGG